MFIKNYDHLATSENRKIILDLIESAFASIQPHAVMDKQFVLENDKLTIVDQTFNLSEYDRIHLIGLGKGSAEVSRIIEEKLGDRLTQGFDIDVVDEAPFKKIEYTKGTHPLPSQENITYTEKVLNAIKNMTEKDLVLVVICGGGSVMFEKPYAVNLDKLTTTVKALLKSGATISEMNVIRKHLSSVKGGQLAKHLHPATVASLIFSDVPGNDLSVIASAPTVKDPTTMDDVKEILQKYNVAGEVTLSDSDFTETPQEDSVFEKVHNLLVVSNQTALHAMQEKAKEHGVEAYIATDKFQSDAKEAGKKLLDMAEPGKIMLVGGETTVHVTGFGQGGRNQTLVLASLPYLTDGTIIASFDSDGWDFTTLAGAIADESTVKKAKDMDINWEALLKNDDSLAFWKEISEGVNTGKLESNVSDLMIVWKEPDTSTSLSEESGDSGSFSSDLTPTPLPESSSGQALKGEGTLKDVQQDNDSHHIEMADNEEISETLFGTEHVNMLRPKIKRSFWQALFGGDIREKKQTISDEEKLEETHEVQEFVESIKEDSGQSQNDEGADSPVSQISIESVGIPASPAGRLNQVQDDSENENLKENLKEVRHDILDISDEKLFQLEEKAVEARELVIQTLVEAGSGHSAGPLGMADIFTAFYFHILNHDPKNPDWEDRDRLVLSNGHICPIRYVSMAQAGYFPIEELKTLRKINSRLQGHPHRTALSGLETTSGPLGEGVSQAIGIALAARLDNKKYRTYVITGDGELDEGNIWEALLYAGKLKLNNLTLVVDRNNIQIDGFTENVLPLESLKAKFEAFGWKVLEVDGHNIRMFVDGVREVQAVYEQPVAIIAHTIPGKGVDFMENDFHWHGVPPDAGEVKDAPPKGEQAKKALDELRTLQGKIESEHQS